MTDARLVVGLGNPTPPYERTYHNAGFRVIDAVLAEIGGECAKREGQALTCHARIDGKKAIFAKPQTFMNLSGDAVRALVDKYKIDPKNVLIVYDDVDLPAGALRFRERGSAGTHNGMRDIVLKVGEECNRLRVGIGRPPERMDLADFVLSRPTAEAEKVFSDTVALAARAAIDFAAGDAADKLGRTYNTRADHAR